MTKIAWIAFLTLLKKEVLRLKRIWVQTLLPPAITTALYFLIFGKLIGARIGAMDGVPYLHYIAPGLIMMMVIQNAYANVCSSFFSAKFQRSIEELIIAPMPPFLMMWGYIGGGVARALIVAVIVTLTSLFFTHVLIHHLLMMFGVILLTAILFSLAGLLNAIFAKSFDDISIIPTFVLTPLTYLGGVFYSIHLLPAFWQKVSMANPVLYMINAFRYSMLGVSDVDIRSALVMITLFTIALFFLCLILLKKGVGIRS
jgi:ABC-2 type transport system permease protein